MSEIQNNDEVAVMNLSSQHNMQRTDQKGINRIRAEGGNVIMNFTPRYAFMREAQAWWLRSIRTLGE